MPISAGPAGGSPPTRNPESSGGTSTRRNLSATSCVLSNQSRKAPLADPPDGTVRHADGAGAWEAPVNRSGRSELAVDGGFPVARAPSSAHHPSRSPSRRRTATRPCAGSSSVYVQPSLPPFAVIESCFTTMEVIGPVLLLNFQPLSVAPPPRRLQPEARSTMSTSVVRPAEL